MSAAVDGARLEVVDEDRMSVILPGDWARIPLDDQDAANAEISRLLRRQVPRRDDLATVRHDAREMARGLARDARESGGIFLALSLELLPGLPFAAALLAHYVEEPRFEDIEEDLPLEVRLAAALPTGDVLELDNGLAVRGWELDRPPADEPDAVTAVRFNYILPSPFAGRWLQLFANVPTEVDPELIAQLFDAIAGSIRWYPPMGSAPHSEA